jgi:hypothetical protein
VKRSLLAVVGALVLASALLGVAANGMPYGSARAHFRASVVGQTRTPAAGKRWRFVVRAVDSSGRGVKGTAIVRVLAGGRRVDTVGWFGFKGVLRRTYRWSPSLLGIAAVLEVKVVGPRGTVTVRYPVRVSPVAGSPRFSVRVSGQSRRPVAGKAWSFSVHAVTANRTRFSGTAIMRVLVQGKVVDTIGWFGFKGYLHRTYHWSTTLRGRRAVLQAKVVGPGGIRTVGYAVSVR